MGDRDGALEIRVAKPGEAEALTALALAAKASWGYPGAWLREWTPTLTFTPAYVEEHHVFVAERASTLVGVVALECGAEAEVGHLWVSPDAQRTGVGRRLMAHASDVARREGFTELVVVSDPHARDFYERLGAVYEGETPSPVAGLDRTIPRLRLSLGGANDEQR